MSGPDGLPGNLPNMENRNALEEQGFLSPSPFQGAS